jgi:3-oxoacyl-[acyl-carrier-protein] synthase III
MLHIIGMASHHPTETIDNQFIEDLDIGTNRQWIEEKIGVMTRVTTLNAHYIRVTKNKNPQEAARIGTMNSSQLGIIAAKKAIQAAGLKPENIGMCIVNSCYPSYTMPSMAAGIAKEVGVSGDCFDVASACPAFAIHLDFLNRYRPECLPDYILCIAASSVTHCVDYNDRSDGAIWGDGAAAWIVAPRAKGRLCVEYTSFDADPTRSQAVVVDRYAHFRQDGRAVRDFSVRQTVRLLKKLEVQFNINWQKDIFIGHQANRTMLEQVRVNRKIPPENHWFNVSTLGNQGGAGAPAVLAENWGKLCVGQKIAVAVVGAGLSWGAVLLNVQD